MFQSRQEAIVSIVTISTLFVLMACFMVWVKASEACLKSEEAVMAQKQETCDIGHDACQRECLKVLDCVNVSGNPPTHTTSN